jgi:hypothetical protein
VDRDDPRAAALGPAHAQQAPLEVDVVDVEPEQLRAAQPGVGEQRQQQPVALALAGVLALPHVAALDRAQQPAELALVEHVRQRLRLLRRAQHRGRVALDRLVLDQEAEEPLQRRDRARLARRRRPPLRLCGQEAAQLRRADLAPAIDPLALEEGATGAHVALIRLTRERRQPPLHRQKFRKSSSSARIRASFGRPRPPSAKP